MQSCNTELGLCYKMTRDTTDWKFLIIIFAHTTNMMLVNSYFVDEYCWHNARSIPDNENMIFNTSSNPTISLVLQNADFREITLNLSESDSIPH